MSRALNVQDRGGFFDDPFFRDSWTDFDSAVQRVLNRFDDPAGVHRSDSMHSQQSQNNDMYRDSRSSQQNEDRYRNLRSSQQHEEDPYASQALKVTEKDGRFQVVMDVKDFNPRNLQVRAVEDNRIVVEGKYQQLSEETGASSWKTFSKEFTLPDEADIDLVTTALSKDGVLTIKAPRKDIATITNKPKSSTVQSINESFDEQRTADGVSSRSFKSTSSSTASSSTQKNVGSKTLQNSSSFESCDSGLDSLPRDIRDRLMVNESGFSSMSNSNSSCSSPAPSEAASDISRVSTSMEFDIGNTMKNNSTQKSEVKFKVEAPEITKLREAAERSSSYAECRSTPDRVKTPDQKLATNQSFGGMERTAMYPSQNQNNPPKFMSPATRTPTFTPGCGSLGDKSVTVEEKDGKKTVKTERSNVIREKNGLVESHEVSAEIDEKDGKTERREAVTRIQRQNEDPSGRFKEDEKAEASDVNEACFKTLPDGSKVSIKRNSTSSSSQKSFSASGGSDGAFNDPFFNAGFSSDFGDLRGLMGRGHSLMSQMSTDSMASTLSGRSGASERSSSRMSDTSRTSSKSDMSQKSSGSSRSDMSQSSSGSHRSQCSDTNSQSTNRSSFFDRSRMGDEMDFPSRQSNVRDQFGLSDNDSFFSSRLSNRPSLAERFPSFSDSLAEFDDFHTTNFPDFPSKNSRQSKSSQSSNNSFSSNSSFGSHFNDKF